MTKRSVRCDAYTVYIQIGRETKLVGGEKYNGYIFERGFENIITVLYSNV